MFDIAWSHILLIGVVALLVIGPKDLPKVLRTVGSWVGRARAIAREFQGSLDQMIREAELEEVRRQVEKATTVNLDHEVEKTLDPAGEMERAINEPAFAADAPTPPETLPPPAPQAAEPAAPAPADADAEPPPSSGTRA